MKKTALLLATVSALAAAGSAAAAELTFNNISVGYSQVDFDCDTNCDGFGLGVSGELNETFFIGGGIGRFSFFGEDVSVYNLDLGARMLLSDTTALYGTVGAAKASTDFGSSDTELALGVGVRALLAPSFELDGSIGYVNVDGADPTFNLTGTWFFTETVGVSLGLDASDDIFGGSVGLRVNF